ncbi:hypothetical protein FJTKL_05361 [Diaporthe vaccinii]|uniref:MYND-type domain-containing protein n=1 Tax=Diaporthe vaccinii TaxID=105482 RepID=A0ABR4FFJ4_9PEZI
MEFQPICANWSAENTTCKKAGKFCCKNCQLLTYCGPECQRSHWTIHKIDCKSFLGKSTWQPDWVLQNRLPAFVGDGPLQVAFGGRKYLWGNVPAFDILQLVANEGEAYDRPLRLLFAASGDLRNVIKTLARLPNSYNQTVEVTVNDRDLDVVARDIILLLIALVIDDIDKAIDCIIHLWYSALVRESDLDIIQKKIRPIVEDVCHKIEGKAADSLQAKTWIFGQRSLRLVLQKSAWDALLTFFDNPDGLTAERANLIRKAVTLAEDRKDYRDRHLLFQAHTHRVALTRFREDGLLLPFGTPRGEFNRPNPTIFQMSQSWSMPDNADPLTGWSAKEVHNTSAGLAKADIYGKLFVHLRTVLAAFLHRLSSLQISFVLYQEDASALPKYLNRGSYSRIEVSNIADTGYMGIYWTLNCMIPLLQTPLDNPHATLITLFMNAVDENITDAEICAHMNTQDPTMKRILQYLSFSPRQPIPNDPIIFKILAARGCVRTMTPPLTGKWYMAKFEFAKAPELVGAVVKTKHTVIEKWPFRLKLRPGLRGAQEEFDRLFSSGVSSQECYLEWKRI